jgi:Subtilase family
MDMQHMHTGKMPMHDTFWRDDQVTILFQSAIPLINEDGTLNRAPLQELQLPQQLIKLNRFLRENGVPVTLHFLNDGQRSKPDPDRTAPTHPGDRIELADSLQLPPGIYPFGFTAPLESSFGLIRTSVISFLQIKQHSSQGGSGNVSMTMRSSHGENDDTENDDDDHDGLEGKFVPQIVGILNENLKKLQSDQGGHIPITITAPAWLSGGTPGISQGCPLTPPMPLAVTDSCLNWHIDLPNLPEDLKLKTGKGVTVFILDSFPERGVITRAAQDAGNSNLLLGKVNATAAFDYSLMSGVQEMQVMADTNNAFVGKDVYGRHYSILMADHGLFIAGIVRDVARDAQIECIRVLDDLCVGNLQTIVDALNTLYFRKALSSGNLNGQAVVVNLSLVIPTDEEANSQGIDTTIGGFNNVWANLKQVLQSLSDLGVIIAASAGNEADLRELPPGANRPDALYPAKFANAPDSIEGVIPVGAVTSCGNPASYSCYPGLRGVATYGGEVPTVTPPDPPNPPSDNIQVTISDAPVGIFSSVEYPPLQVDPPDQYYTAPDNRAWAYWVGTSFATPIISALAARILEGPVSGNIPQVILNAATDTTKWDRLDPSTDGSSTATGNMLTAIQSCVPEQ